METKSDRVDSLLRRLEGISPSVIPIRAGEPDPFDKLFSNQPDPDPFFNQPDPDPFFNQPTPDPFTNQPDPDPFTNQPPLPE